MNLVDKLKAFLIPYFLTCSGAGHNRQTMLNYRALWLLSMFFLAVVSLIPLSILTYSDYRLSELTIRSEFELKTIRTTSNARRAVSFFLDERRAALEFTLREESYQALTDPEHLAKVLRNLKVGFGGFIDLGVIDANGRQVSYQGQFDLLGRTYTDQFWFMEALRTGAYVSDVFLGYRDVPHVVIASRDFDDHGVPFILRATLDIEQLVSMLVSLEMGENGDAFIINNNGVLQTPSQAYGSMLDTAGIEVPPFSDKTSQFRTVDRDQRPVLVTYAYILDSPFILCVVKPLAETMKAWMDQRRSLMWVFSTSICSILVAIYLIATYLTNAIHEANHRQVETMERMEQTGRLASIGRLAAGVAHEINNPLAVISERAGLVRDMLAFADPPADERIVNNIDIVLESVDRCGKITKQLLGFARKVELDVEVLKPEQVVRDVLTFIGKEAEYRNIKVNVLFEPDVLDIRSDRGKLQQIMLNLITNAFQAMDDGGTLTIRARMTEDQEFLMEIEDTGCGIPKENLKHIFEPFFTTKGAKDGSGLGLAITYGLVSKLDGKITVASEQDKGTTFTIKLPLEMGRSNETH